MGNDLGDAASWRAIGDEPGHKWIGDLLGSLGRLGRHSSRHLRGNFCPASKLSAALWSKTAALCFAFSSGQTSTVDSVPFGSIRTTCHPKDLASYRSRFMLRICAPDSPFSSEQC